MALDASYAHHDVMGARHDAPGARHGTCRVHPGRDGLIPSDARLRREKERRVPPLRPQLAPRGSLWEPKRGGAVLCAVSWYWERDSGRVLARWQADWRAEGVVRLGEDF